MNVQKKCCVKGCNPATRKKSHRLPKLNERACREWIRRASNEEFQEDGDITMYYKKPSPGPSSAGSPGPVVIPRTPQQMVAEVCTPMHTSGTPSTTPPGDSPGVRVGSQTTLVQSPWIHTQTKNCLGLSEPPLPPEPA